MLKNSNERAISGSAAAEQVIDSSQKTSLISTLRNSLLGFASGVKSLDARQWRKIALTLAGFIGLNIGFTYVSRVIFARMNLHLDSYAGLCYLTVFLTFLVTNLALFSPLPLAMTVLVTTSQMWNPAIIGLAAAIGASIGELSGYFAGMVGRKFFIRENFMCSLNERLCNSRLSADVQRHGPLAIGILAAQPILPFDVAGLIAGSLRMNLFKFFGALLAGKTFKYVLMAYFAGVLSMIPFIKIG